jgi:hypothetical protein
MKNNLRAMPITIPLFLCKYRKTVQSKLLILYTIIITISVQLISCDQTVKPIDPAKNKQIALACNKYIKGNPSYFPPPGPFQSDPSVQYADGRVAWTASIQFGNPIETANLDNYQTRLNNATIKNQTNWSQYKMTTNCGFPGLQIDQNTYNPPLDYQAGFICYAIPYNAIIDAGFKCYDNFIPGNCQDLVSKLTLYPVYQARIGDIVAYSFRNNGTIDHVGVIVDTSDADPKNWMVISSIGIIEIFEYGASIKRLGVFGSKANGGEFNTWDPALDNWTFTIYGATN